jgi:hypothetical protein
MNRARRPSAFAVGFNQRTRAGFGPILYRLKQGASMQLPGTSPWDFVLPRTGRVSGLPLFQDTLYDPQNLKTTVRTSLMRGLNLVLRIQSPNTSRAGPNLIRTVLSPVMQDTLA